MTRRGVNPCLICTNDAVGSKGSTVCAECRRKVGAYDDLRARSLDGAVTICLPLYPYVPGSKGTFGVRSVDVALDAPGMNARGRLEILLQELRRQLDTPARCNFAIAEGESREGGVQPRRSPLDTDLRSHGFDRNLEYANVPKLFAQFMLDLGPFLEAALNEAERAGKRQGADLLAMLAGGELTNQEFERRAGIAKAKP